MNRSTVLRAGVLTLGAALFSGYAVHAKGGRHGHGHDKSPGVVFQVSDNGPTKWNLALNNAKNVQSRYGADKVIVEIVAYGTAIHMAGKATANRAIEAKQAGVKVVACQNTMRAMKHTEANMNSSIGYVPSHLV